MIGRSATVGVFLPNWIGDVVMATPALRAMREHLGSGSRMIGIMRPYVADVLSGTPWLSDVWHVDRKSRDPRLCRRRLVRRLRAARLDAAVLMTNSFGTALLATLGGARRRVGYVRYGRGLLLTDKLYPPRDGRKLRPVPAIDYYLELARALGCRARSRRMELAVLPEHRESAANVWRRLQIPADRPVVALNAGGAYGAAKHWPAEHCGALAARIARRHDRTVLVLCGPAEAEAARDVVRIAADARVVSLADIPTSIGESKACIARCSLMISTDSGPRHMAVALGVPTIALFGPTDPRWSESYADHATSLWHDVPCGPCHRRVCPEGHHRCMRDLTVDRVMAEVTRRLEQERRDAA